MLKTILKRLKSYDVRDCGPPEGVKVSVGIKRSGSRISGKADTNVAALVGAVILH